MNGAAMLLLLLLRRCQWPKRRLESLFDPLLARWCINSAGWRPRYSGPRRRQRQRRGENGRINASTTIAMDESSDVLALQRRRPRAVMSLPFQVMVMQSIRDLSFLRVIRPYPAANWNQ
jgi:hypothetical protein